MLGQAVRQLAYLPTEDLPLVLEFLQYLQKKHPITKPSSQTATELVAEIRRRAQKLDQVPRAELVAQFRQLTEEVRQEAVANGPAITGDWHGD
jgi:hypothetical protein